MVFERRFSASNHNALDANTINANIIEHGLRRYSLVNAAADSKHMSQMSVQAAAQGRDVPTPPPAAGPLPPSQVPKSEPNAKSAAPDLDAMARQVYSILKRRLANERYRS